MASAPAEIASLPEARGELGLRIVSAAVLVPVGLAGLWAGGLAWDALVLIGVVGAVMEWRAMSGEGRRGGGAPVVALAIFACLIGIRFGPVAGLVPVLAGALLLFGLQWPAAAVGLGYVSLPGIALTWLRGERHGGVLLLMVLLSVWASDTGAYVAGRCIGGPRLAPSISPSKTWSGALGGLVCCAVVGLFGWHFGVFATAAGGAAAAVALGIAAQLGDLFESAAKRRFGVKDSGRLIPGHGGLLDRLDGLMAASVLAAAWVWTAR